MIRDQINKTPDVAVKKKMLELWGPGVRMSFPSTTVYGRKFIINFPLPISPDETWILKPVYPGTLLFEDKFLRR